jgi:DNA gyrase subunit A
VEYDPASVDEAINERASTPPPTDDFTQSLSLIEQCFSNDSVEAIVDPSVATTPAVDGETAEAAVSKEGLRAQGRFTGGVTAMRFKKKGDYVQALEVCDKEARLLVAREDGVGKRTPFEDYRMIRRGGTGVIAIDLPDDGSVAVAGALSVRDTDEVMLLTAKGQSVRTRVSEIRETGRGAKGVRLVNLEEGDKLLAIAKVIASAEVEPTGSTPPIEPTV